jgi:hypothetical protein
MNNTLESELNEFLNIEIATEILREINPDIAEDKINEIWDKCNGNPWNAGILYKLFELKENKLE